jgi:hypothetical protein
MDAAVIGALIPIIAIVGGFTVAIASIMAKSRVRELQIRERIAMIEKGLVPAPEVDPAGFDRAMGRYDRRGWPGYSAAGRHRRAGIILIGVGIGMTLLIGLPKGSFRQGLGVGGFLAILGFAFLISSLFDHTDRITPSDPASPPSPPSPRISGPGEGH